MRLVEVIKGSVTSDQSVNSAIDFVGSIGKNPILVNDSPGFLVNRLLFPMINEAINALMEGVACKEDIDASMRLGANHPMGPLELADLIGLDTCLEVLENLFEKFEDTKFLPSPLLKSMVEKGCLGKKTGKGFYSYTN
jgi:3-hydroxybutyryl-CoA dehydrogenase